MTDVAACVARAPATAAESAQRRSRQARYRLQPGLEVFSASPGSGAGGVLFSTRPLMALRLNATGVALLRSLESARTVADAAAGVKGLSTADAAAFLDTLAERRLVSRTPPAMDRWPPVSIIVPARGRHAATRACLESLLALDYPGEPCEIIVVDDASEPPLADALSGLPVRVLRQEHNIGQSAARNLGAADAMGELLAFIDNDCVADPAWLTDLVPCFGDTGIGIVGGRVVAPPADGRIAAFEAVRSPLDMGVVEGPVGPRAAIQYLPTCNLVVKRDLLLAQGGFNSSMRVGEDVDFVWRALSSGARACYAPAGRVVHFHRAELQSLLWRRADYGSSEADLQRLHPVGRRTMRLPKVAMLLMALLTALGVSWPIAVALVGAAAVMIALELLNKSRKLRRTGVAVPLRRIGAAVLREHGASLYHLSATMTRYYGLPLLGLALLWPPLLPAAALLLLAAPIADDRRTGPGVSLPMFVGLYWLEMAAYQIGVWRGCLSRRTLRPLLPALRWGR